MANSILLLITYFSLSLFITSLPKPLLTTILSPCKKKKTFIHLFFYLFNSLFLLSTHEKDYAASVFLCLP